MDFDPVLADLNRYLAEEELDHAFEEEAERLDDELQALMQDMPPVCAHNLRMRVEAAGDDLERRRQVLERAWRAA